MMDALQNGAQCIFTRAPAISLSVECYVMTNLYLEAPYKRENNTCETHRARDTQRENDVNLIWNRSNLRLWQKQEGCKSKVRWPWRENKTLQHGIKSWAASFALRTLYSRDKNRPVRLVRRLGGPHSSSERDDEEKIPAPAARRTPPIQPIAGHFTNVSHPDLWGNNKKQKSYTALFCFSCGGVTISPSVLRPPMGRLYQPLIMDNKMYSILPTVNPTRTAAASNPGLHDGNRLTT